ncbi:MAG: DegV domain-containing protein [Paraeggerthella hongkongensis]|uniref:DegV family protein n=1 Tax=Paraeggerthella TaxID=651554 RepID=UPI001C0F58D8|nr:MULTISPECIES: DegV family protein [Paraeggerthella]MBU5405898.1 DegV family EDD domain-containing protein [Paraeggerthella hongkongensis]MCD2433745.1 DegV family EDD domain-containing protein [Paraeggerthella hominis]
MRIVADSSVMYSIEQGAARGMKILPLAVTIDNETWLEYEEITTEDFLARVRAGAMPQSSCPPPHLTLEAYDTEEEVLHITMADGLSGAYGVAHGLAKQAPHPERVHVVNSATLCAPHRALALAAVELAKRCEHAADVIERLRPMIASAHSFLLPEDFEYLRRGGRLTPLAAKFAHLVKAAPVMCQTDDGTRLERLAIARSFKKGVEAVVAELEKRGVGEGHFISVSHADNPEGAGWAMDRLKAAFSGCRFGVYDLGPAFITQGGPACIAIQSIDLKAFPDLAMG